ncbi:MAG: TIGR01777 family oxidoreductase [Planctomycetota bacterium]
MIERRFRQTSGFDVSAEVLWTWHQRPGALERLVPPWERTRIVERSDDMAPGSRTTLEVGLGPFKRLWVAEHRATEEPFTFRDVQVSGPFAAWSHTHRIEAGASGSSLLTDDVCYAVPFGRLGALVAGGIVRGKLESMFRYRHDVLRSDLARHQRLQPSPVMKVLISGSSGFVGSALSAFLASGGHEVWSLVRKRGNESVPERSVAWDAETYAIESRDLEGFDAVVHLAGENIAGKRWSAEQKRKIKDSRVDGTRALSEALAKCTDKPRVLVSASAVGWYGNRGDERVTELSEPGQGFLPEVCRAWEAATGAAEATGIRVVYMRTGVVLSPAGGALKKMLLPFKLGGGGVIGDGKQWMSWIALDDLVGAYHFALTNERLAGPVNAVAPSAVRNYEFTKTLGKVLKRPTIVPLPAFAARAAFGEMADDLLLGGQHVRPMVLENAGFHFDYPTLEGALRHVLGRERERAA